MAATSRLAFGSSLPSRRVFEGLVVFHRVHGRAFSSTAGLLVVLVIETRDPLRLTHFALRLEDFVVHHAGSSQFPGPSLSSHFLPSPCARG
jgi:hypothetical protein